MTRLVVLGICFVAGTEVLVLLLHQRRLLLLICGAAVTLLLLGFRLILERDTEIAEEQTDSSAENSLQHWLANAEPLVRWSKSSRRDWDRHWRPMLAVRFQNATGQSREKNATTFNATGRMLSAPNCGDGWTRPTSPMTAAMNPGPAVQRSRRFWSDWSRHDRRFAGCDDHRALRRGAR